MKPQNTNEPAAPEEQTEFLEMEQTKAVRHWKVVLYNDEDHTYDYVVDLLVAVCGMAKEQAFRCAVEVDMTGRTTVFYGNKEECSLRSGKINTWGADHRLLRSRGSMNSCVEPS